MRNVYTVKQINSYIRNMFTQDFMLSRIYVKGEVSNCKYHPSGHIYFSLKDESGMIACVMFAGQRNGLAFRMSDGQQVIAFGGMNIYEQSGRYQLYAKEIVLDGAGVLYEKFQQMKENLREMGMFAEEYKQQIPQYAMKIGIVTAPSGAAVRDIIQVAKRRNPYVQLILYPAQVQGEGAAASIVRGIQTLSQEQVDVMIVGRGGGSIEELWAFNEEAVARAVFECPVPVISAVGHETDTTIIDYVADLRAPTPSAAAELAVFEYRQLTEYISETRNKLKRAFTQEVRVCRSRIKEYQTSLFYLHPGQILREKRQRAADIEEKMRMMMEQALMRNRHRFKLSAEMLKGLSPIEKLSQGYSYVRNTEGMNIKSVQQVNPGELLEVCVTDGVITTRIENVLENGKETGNGKK